MDILNYMFSFLCAQNGLRSFMICGENLDFCHRCTGFYIGMGMTFLYFLLTGSYKRQISNSILCINISSILVMLIFGFHILDPGPKWRLWSGIVYGHAIVCLILPGAWQFCVRRADICYSPKALVCFFAFFGILNIIPLWFPLQSELFHLFVNFLAIVGFIFPVVCGIAVLGSLLGKAVGFLFLRERQNGIENT